MQPAINLLGHQVTAQGGGEPDVAQRLEALLRAPGAVGGIEVAHPDLAAGRFDEPGCREGDDGFGVEGHRATVAPGGGVGESGLPGPGLADQLSSYKKTPRSTVARDKKTHLLKLKW